MKKPKQMVEIQAECSRHGKFILIKKPNRYRSDAGGAQNGKYCAVVCPKCSLWATIISQRIIEPATIQPAATQKSLI
jgi:hypothetical protein